MTELHKRVIVALDHQNLDDAFRLVEEVDDKIDWYKVGPILFTRHGSEVIQFLHRRSKNIFLDLKLHDIPNVVARTVHQVAELGVKFLTLHCLGGRKMLMEAGSACRQSQLKLLGVTLLTSHGREDSRELGWDEDEASIVKRMLNLAVESRLAGVICSPNEISMVRESTLPGFQVVTPGIRLVDKEVYQDDQKRIASPKEALTRGADFIVIGRPITSAREPRQVVDDLFEN